MGSNDHNPTGSATLRPWKQGPAKETLFWANVPANLIVEIVSAASRVGAYVGFGAAQEQTALLLYVKNGRINERIALESIKEAKDFANYVINTWLDAPH